MAFCPSWSSVTKLFRLFIDQKPPKISLIDLPNAENIIFEDTLFFRRANAQLPAPSKVRLDVVRQKDDSRNYSSRPPPVSYQDLNLFVKYGREITLAEGLKISAYGSSAAT